MSLEPSVLRTLPARSQMSTLIRECFDEIIGLEDLILLPSPQTILPIKSFVVDSPESFVQYDLTAVYASTFPVCEHQITFYAAYNNIFFCSDKQIQLGSYHPSKETGELFSQFTHALIKPDDLTVQALATDKKIFCVQENLVYKGFHKA